MKTAVLRSRCAHTLIACVLLTGAAQAQQGEGTGLPAELANLSVPEFAQAALSSKEDPTVPGPQREAIRKRAAELLEQFDFANAPTTDYPTMDALGAVAGGAVSREAKERMRAAFQARVDDWTNRPYDEIRGKVLTMVRLRLHLHGLADAKRWVAAGGTRERIEASEVGAADLNHPYAPVALKVLFGQGELVMDSFTIVWEGRLTAPRTGQYKLSISPINVNGSYEMYDVHQAMDVTLAGQKIISATADNWQFEAEPKNLTAGQALPLRVEYKASSRVNPRGSFHAILRWEGPGISKSAIGGQYLSLPDEDEPGLQAIYSWKDAGEPKSAQRVDSNIDFAWPLGGIVVAAGQNVQAESDLLSNLIWQQASSPQFIAQLEQTKGKHPFVTSPEGSAAMLTMAQRRAFLDILVEHPILLDAMDPMEVMWIYRSFRLCNEDQAFDFLTAWAERNAHHLAAMPASIDQPAIDERFRDACRLLGDYILVELPLHGERLKQGHLELENGDCCLPVAYMLGSGSLSTGVIGDWISTVDQKLAAPSLDGDRRVNWLIARAQAEEIRLSTPRARARHAERPVDGRAWLEEALLVAESPGAKTRAALELASRYAAAQQFDQAREFINRAAQSAPQQLAADLEARRQIVDGLEARLAAAPAEQEAEAKANYVRSLRDRRARAEARGDQGAVSRYDALIGAASNN